jgi:hypothetical protein
LFDLVFEQEQTKVGLVLSGGGAKVCTHRVLKVLEEAGLKLIILEEQVWGLLVGCMHQDIPQLKLILFSIDKF